MNTIWIAGATGLVGQALLGQFQGTPAPTPAINGVYFDSSHCLVVAIEGVKAILINGRGAAPGRFCSVDKFEVVIR